MQSGELVGEHAHHDEIVIPPGEEHVIAKAAFFDEAESALKYQRCISMLREAKRMPTHPETWQIRAGTRA